MSDYRFEEQLALAATNESIRSFVKAHVEGRLQLRPAFQRNLVWNGEQKSYLVDSILRNLPIPEVYIQIEDVPGRHEDLMIVVDGQQRISTCIEFIHGTLRLRGDALAPEWAGRTFPELSSDLQNRFSRYKLVVRELPRLGDAVIREIFTRLNRVVEPLVPQELRHAAYSGQYIKLIEQAAAHPVLQELRVFSANDFRRRGNEELIAEIIHAHIHRAFPNKKEGLDEGFKFFDTHGFPDDTAHEVKRRFGRVVGLLQRIVTAIRNTRFRNKSDFYSLMVFLIDRAESLPLPLAGEATFIKAVQSLSERISAFRRAALAGQDIEATSAEDVLALKYMRAVERAASDRLSRVRRDDVLREWLGPALASGEVQVLGASDEAWLTEIDFLEEESEAEIEAERQHLAEVLTRDSETPVAGASGAPPP
jgi:hypothetical protein